jgi:hypothetical protein
VLTTQKWGQHWVVYDPEADYVHHLGEAFLPAWALAVDLATRMAPASAVALNDSGEMVALTTCSRE